MAVVILGGLVTSTLLSLFVLPILYLRVGRSTERARDESGARDLRGNEVTWSPRG